MPKKPTPNVPAEQAKANLPVNAATLDALASVAGQGLESVRREDIILPRFSILQALSPQVNRRESEYIEGAEQGQIVNVATGELFDALTVIPVAYQRRHIEWRPRKAGGGLVNDYGTDESILTQCKVQEKGPAITPAGNELVVTGTWYVLHVSPDGAMSQAFIPMSSTQLKASRKWMTLVTSDRVQHPTKGWFQPPIYFRSYNLTTVPESNDQGNWFGWRVERGATILDLPEGQAIMSAAQRFALAVTTGEVQAKAESFADERRSEEGEKF